MIVNYFWWWSSSSGNAFRKYYWSSLAFLFRIHYFFSIPNCLPTREETPLCPIIYQEISLKWRIKKILQGHWHKVKYIQDLNYAHRVHFLRW